VEDKGHAFDSGEQDVMESGGTDIVEIGQPGIQESQLCQLQSTPEIVAKSAPGACSASPVI
jgi:hypothetical protein